MLSGCQVEMKVYCDDDNSLTYFNSDENKHMPDFRSPLVDVYVDISNLYLDEISVLEQHINKSHNMKGFNK